MLNNRRHMRFREIADVRWRIMGEDISGEGKVLNISSSGLRMQMGETFDPTRRGNIYIDTAETDPLGFGSKRGKIVWLTPLPEGRKGYQCGVAFLEDSYDKTLHEWIDRKVDDLAKASNPNILKNYIS